MRSRASKSSCLLVLPVLLLMTGNALPAMDPFDQVKRMGRGVNILGYDPIWRDLSKARFKESHFKRIREGGFQTVRVNLQAFRHMDAEDRLSPAWFKTRLQDPSTPCLAVGPERALVRLRTSPGIG